MAAAIRQENVIHTYFVVSHSGAKVPIVNFITGFAIPEYHLTKNKGLSMGYLVHQADHCKTAQDVLEVSHKVLAWRRAHWQPSVRQIEPPKPIAPPEPIPEPLPPIITSSLERDWLFANPDYDRGDKWPAGFISRIKSLVSKEFMVPLIDIDAARRNKEIIIPRHVAIYLCKTLTLKSLPEIGHRFGYRDHTTILHAVRATIRRMREDAELCQLIVELQERLEQDLARWRAYG